MPATATAKAYRPAVFDLSPTSAKPGHPPMLPAIFLSHGAPTLPLIDAPARDFLSGLGRELGRPSAILVASAHWETPAPMVSTIARNTTIHDFYGFPRELYQLVIAHGW